MRLERPLRLATLALFLGTVSVSGLMIQESTSLDARMLKEPTVKSAKDLEWKIFDEEMIEAGVTIPAATHAVLYLPYDVTASGTILREVLFGGQGYSVRYWGYCFPADKTVPVMGSSTGFPGKLFLSEAERSARNAEARKKLRTISPFNLPTKTDLKRQVTPYDGRLRHQKEVFEGGEHCYVMSAKQLFIGTDSDGDRLNTSLEKKYETSAEWDDLDGDGIADGYDTDQDGISDGVEALDGGTNPLLRDTDQDGIIDGVEDGDRDGIVDAGETNPLSRDSDKDGLCDGYCVLGKQTRTCRDFMHTIDCKDTGPQFAGEDRNLNGVIDEGETDPLKWDSKGDGYNDLQRYYKCLLDGGTDC